MELRPSNRVQRFKMTEVAADENANTNGLSDIDRKRQLKLQKLADLQRERIAAKQQTDDDTNKATNSQQSDAFLLPYNTLKQQLAVLLDPQTKTTTVGIWSTQCNELLQQLRTHLNTHAYALNAHDLRQHQQEVQQLAEKFTTLEQQLAPKRKFGFKDRGAAAGTTAKPTSAATAAPATTATPPTVTAPTASTHAASIHQSAPSNSGVEVHHQHNKFIYLSPSVTTDKDISLSHLTHCTILITGVPTQLRVDHLTDCNLLVGPIAGSVHMEHAVNCNITLCSRQIRLHDSTHTHFYCFVNSHPIIERCHSVHFAPYNLQYPLYEQHFQQSKLNATVNMWSAVNDFNWLKQQQSPNWSILEEAQRKAVTLHDDDFAAVSADSQSKPLVVEQHTLRQVIDAQCQR